MASLDGLIEDVRFALRLLRKRPAFTAPVTLSLALGIAANTAIFSLIDAVMWRTLPVTDPEGLVLLTHGRGTSFRAASLTSNTGSCASSRAGHSRSWRRGRRPRLPLHEPSRGDAADRVSDVLQTRTGRGQMALYERLATAPGAAFAEVRQAAQDIDWSLPLFDIHTLAEEMGAVLIRDRLIATLSTVFCGLALILACVGLYGLLACSVVQRRAEMGIRMVNH